LPGPDAGVSPDCARSPLLDDLAVLEERAPFGVGSLLLVSLGSS
jgi:hypothetical protein